MNEQYLASPNVWPFCLMSLVSRSSMLQCLFFETVFFVVIMLKRLMKGVQISIFKHREYRYQKPKTKYNGIKYLCLSYMLTNGM